ncbi:MAG TPA: FkbM family methyltransferase [Cyclobacteriaceae bacterium]
MFELFTGYKRFPYPVPLRSKLTNVIRYIFKMPLLEKFLISQLTNGNKEWWKKFIPPLYFYSPGSIRYVVRDNIHYRLDVSTFLDHAIFFCQMNEDPAHHNLFKVLKHDSVVFDIGANVGYLTLNFARTCSHGHVYSFEPDTQNREALLTNIKLNTFQNINTYKVALGSQRGKASLYKYYPGNPGTNRILNEKPITKHTVEEVNVITLDNFVDEEKISKVDLIKVDVEGFEKFVIEGARKVISKWKPVLFVELVEFNVNQQGYTCASLVEFIESFGYEVKDATTMSAVDKSKKNHNTDILCFHKDAGTSPY